MKIHKLMALFISVFLTISCFSQQFNPPFFVFEDGLWNARSGESAYWASLVKEVGFDGVELIGLEKVDSMLPELIKNNLHLFTLYIQIDLEKEQPYDPRLKEYIIKMKDKGLHLWVHVHSEKYAPSDPGGDSRCVKIVAELADFAHNYGVKIAFYPHADFWVEKLDDGVRLAKKINRSNVGTVFNLCHFLKKDQPDKLDKELRNALPYLFLVSVNGAEEGETQNMGWDKLIQPLGRGNYDVYRVLQILKDIGYHNPVGLQCYNVKGRPEDFLKESMKAWRKYIYALNQ